MSHRSDDPLAAPRGIIVAAPFAAACWVILAAICYPIIDWLLTSGAQP